MFILAERGQTSDRAWRGAVIAYWRFEKSMRNLLVQNLDFNHDILLVTMLCFLGTVMIGSIPPSSVQLEIQNVVYRGVALQ